LSVDLTKSKVMKRFAIYFLTMMVILLSSIIMHAQLQVSSKGGKALTLPESREVLYQQSNSSGPGLASQDFEPSYDIFDCQGADDFIVPSGLLWNIQTVTVTGTGSNTANLVHILLYADNAGMPAATATNSFMGLTCTNESAVLIINIPGGLQLGPGHYWISVQDAVPYSTDGQWFWNFTASIYNSGSCWRNPGNGFGTDAIAWTTLAAMVHPDIGYPDKDFMFRLEGDSTNIILPVPISNWALYIGIGLILVFALVRFRKMV
jgi:hypothetical protein